MTSSPPSKRASLVLEAIGFQRIRQSGSHATYRHPDGRWTIVSIHPGKTIPKGTLRKIIRDAGLTVDEFIELL
ncbi:MAG TPA: type II toxin-antitoxin system HicA family toxin [Anaerolineae bacterium]|nr:type II toxin-antitoxin system HicA family toxin [Anaerolineae bacterium]